MPPQGSKSADITTGSLSAWARCNQGMVSEAELLSSGLPKRSEQPLADLQEDQHPYPEWCRRESLREVL